uniref:Uncharacterized protein n=1 Tax=Helianthus annuus TaxID=4232 RepID=A0A251VQI5_HELAN
MHLTKVILENIRPPNTRTAAANSSISAANKPPPSALLRLRLLRRLRLLLLHRLRLRHSVITDLQTVRLSGGYMNDSCICYIEKEFLQQVSVESVMQRFQKMKTRRQQL